MPVESKEEPKEETSEYTSEEESGQEEETMEVKCQKKKDEILKVYAVKSEKANKLHAEKGAGFQKEMERLTEYIKDLKNRHMKTEKTMVKLEAVKQKKVQHIIQVAKTNRAMKITMEQEVASCDKMLLPHPSENVT